MSKKLRSGMYKGGVKEYEGRSGRGLWTLLLLGEILSMILHEGFYIVFWVLSNLNGML